MSLEDYRRKRDFTRTREPDAEATDAPGKQRRFVIQLHHARARHFDFRLELDGVLRSWAVPKGPSLRPADKRLAVEVEDHPVAYRTFEGMIPEGSYGAGHVRIVDAGTWLPTGDARRGLARGKLDFALRGEHLHGGWSLVRTRGHGARAQWLLVKHDDAHAADTDLDTLVGRPAPPARNGDAAERRPTRKRSAAADGTTTSRWAREAQALEGAVPGKPAVTPQLATLRDRAPDGDGWMHEVKWDGYRMLLMRDGDAITVQSRNGHDWTGRFRGIERALSALRVERVLLDTEVVALDEDGFSDFGRLQAALDGSTGALISAIAFDLLWLDGIDLTACRQIDRKTLLQRVLDDHPDPWLACAEHVIGDGPRVAERVMGKGHEGIISKRVDAPYQEGRTQDWLKVKRRDGTEAVVVGYTAPKGRRIGIGALLLALPHEGALRYAGRVGTGFDDRRLRVLRARLEGLHTDAAAVELPDHVALPEHRVQWVHPELVVEVEHRGTGGHGLLRQASFLRLREDKRVAAAPAQPARVHITHPDRLVYRDPRTTKQEVMDYYQAVATWLLPEVQGRPLSLLRAPDGVGGELFFQKHLSGDFGRGVRTIAVDEASGKRRDYIAIDSVDGLLSLVQMNALEFHPWGVHPGELERPDRITFDLDPGDGVPWSDVVQAALEIRDHLASTGLHGYPLVSGGKGVHVVVPLGGDDGWDAVKRFARALARVLAEDAPARFVAQADKSQRPGKIFIDWLRNGRGATSIAPWSLRARTGAPVAMPVSWPRLAETARSAVFSRVDALRHTAELADHPWGDYRATAQALPRLRDDGDDATAGRGRRAAARGGRRSGR